jgi:hypothetical protein
MRDRRFVSARLLVTTAALMWLVPAFAVAQAGATRVTATEVFDPLNVLGNGAVGAITAPGTVTCPGEQPTGDPAQPCPPGSRVRLRGFSGKSRIVSQSPLLSGWMSWEVNANFDGSAAGPAWGTWRLELDAGGVWEGSYSDARSKVEDMNVWVGRARFVGRGTSGSVNGMHLRFSEVALSYMPMPVSWVGPLDGEVVEAHCR